MAVLIKDMKMPECCGDCKFMVWWDYYNDVENSRCLLDGEYREVLDETKPSWCKLRNISESSINKSREEML